MLGEAQTRGLSVLSLIDMYVLIQSTFESIGPLISRDVSMGGDLDLNALAQSSMIDPPADVMAVFATAQQAGGAYQALIEDPEAYLVSGNGASDGWRQIWKVDATTGQTEYRHYTPSELATLRDRLQDLIDATE
jgi:hypothetical protein